MHFAGSSCCAEWKWVMTAHWQRVDYFCSLTFWGCFCSLNCGLPSSVYNRHFFFLSLSFVCQSKASPEWCSVNHCMSTTSFFLAAPFCKNVHNKQLAQQNTVICKCFMLDALTDATCTWTCSFRNTRPLITKLHSFTCQQHNVQNLLILNIIRNKKKKSFL